VPYAARQVQKSVNGPEIPACRFYIHKLKSRVLFLSNSCMKVSFGSKFSRRVVLNCVVNLFLIFAGLFFFFSPPFSDLLPFLVPHYPLPLSLRAVPPILLVVAIFAWLWRNTTGGWLHLLARFTLILPALIMLASPLLPDILLERNWLVFNCVLILVCPVLLSLVSPTLRNTGRGRRLFFVIAIWLSYLSFMVFLFLLLVRGNPVPLGASFALLTGLLVLDVFLTGKKRVRALNLLAVTAVVFLSAICLQSLIAGRASPWKTDDNIARIEEDGALTCGPYLQNLHRDCVTIMWETLTSSPGHVIVSTREEALCASSERIPPEVRIYESPVSSIHEVLVDGLKENETYYYRVVSNGVPGEIGCFKTAYEGQAPFDFVVYGDSQEVFPWAEYLVHNRHKDICASIASYSPEARFIVHVGDMTFLGNEHERWPREFFGPAKALMQDKVLWPVLGNHELNASWYFDFFSLPNEDEHYYSFDFGNSRFIVLAVEGYAVGHEFGPPTRTPMVPGSPQYVWLEKTLANSRDKTWLFVFFHQGPFGSGIEGAYTPAREIFVPLFEQYHVDAVFTGHNHNYEFSVKDNIAYVVTGGGGGPVNLIQPDKRNNPYSRFFMGTWHHCNVKVNGKRLDVRAIDLKGRVIHHFEVDKTEGEKVVRER